MKKKIIKRKSHMSQYLRFNDKLKFFYVISYKKKNLFLTFSFCNTRINKRFIIQKMSCGIVNRKLIALQNKKKKQEKLKNKNQKKTKNKSDDKEIQIFQRNKFRYMFGYIQPRLTQFQTNIIKFIFTFPKIVSHYFFFDFKLSRIDYGLLMILDTCDFLALLEENKIFFGKLKIKKKQKQKKLLIKRTLFCRLFLKRSHNGCRLAKERFVKKNRIKRGDDFDKDERVKYFSGINKALDDFKDNLKFKLRK